MIHWTKKIIKNILGRVTSPLLNIVTPEQKQQLDQVREKQLLHALNAQAYSLNKGIVQKTATMGEVHLNKEIYNNNQPAPVPPPPPAPIPEPLPATDHIAPQPVQQIEQQDLSPLIDRVTNLEKQVTKFVNLIERNVAKNAKEITIRIKLNENNDSTDSK